MTKIYIYCLFDHHGQFCGVYSSIKAVHRDALKTANRGGTGVQIKYRGAYLDATLTVLRNALKGVHDVKIEYISDKGRAQVIKTKIKE